MGRFDEYRFNYCWQCRRKQLEDNLNSSIEKQLSEKLRLLKSRSKCKDIEYNLDLDFLLNQYNLQNGLCFYTDIKLILQIGQGTKDRNSLSFDRIVPEKGYTKDNVVLAANRINSIKSDCTLEELKLWMPDWFNRLQDFIKNYHIQPENILNQSHAII